MFLARQRCKLCGTYYNGYDPDFKQDTAQIMVRRMHYRTHSIRGESYIDLSIISLREVFRVPPRWLGKVISPMGTYPSRLPRLITNRHSFLHYRPFISNLVSPGIYLPGHPVSRHCRRPQEWLPEEYHCVLL